MVLIYTSGVNIIYTFIFMYGISKFFKVFLTCYFRLSFNGRWVRVIVFYATLTIFQFLVYRGGQFTSH